MEHPGKTYSMVAHYQILEGADWFAEWVAILLNTDFAEENYYVVR